MNAYSFLPRFAIVLVLLIGSLTKAQQIVTAENSNASIPLDPFLEDEEFEKDYPFIVSLKFHLREEMLPQLFSEIALQNMACAFQDCSISLIDIAEATQIVRFSTEDLAQAIGKLKITSDNANNVLLLYKITPDLIENLLATCGLTFSDIYKTFVESLSNPGKSIPEILNILNVSVLDFMSVQAYGNDSSRLLVLSTGDYSQENINSVLNVTNKTSQDMLKLLPLNTIAKQLKKFNPREFTNFVKSFGVTSLNLVDFYKFLNITSINFLSYPNFINILTDFYDLLNPEEVLGTIVTQNEVITSNKAKSFLTYKNQSIDLVRNYANFHAEVVENPLVQYLVQNVNLANSEYQSKDIAKVEIKVPGTTPFAEVSRDYNKTALVNCTYVSKLPYGGLYTENLLHVHLENFTIVVTKSNNTLYSLGSPLLCQDKLYGIATEDSANQIKFSTFLKIIPDTSTTTTTTTTGQQPPGNENVTSVPNVVTISGPSSSIALSCTIFNIGLSLIVLKLSL